MTPERTPLPPIDGLRAYALGRVELRCDDCGQPIVWRWTPTTDVDAARGAHRCPVRIPRTALESAGSLPHRTRWNGARKPTRSETTSATTEVNVDYDDTG